jgi:hypothetical protein
MFIFFYCLIDDFRNEKTRPPLLVAKLLAVVVEQCNYSVALPLSTSKQPTMVGVAFHMKSSIARTQANKNTLPYIFIGIGDSQ